MKRYRVVITLEAEYDMLEIYKYVKKNDSIGRATSLLEKLEETCLSLDKIPLRGHIPPEVEDFGITEFLEIHHKPYRVMYQVGKKTVYIHGVFDGRRDMQKLLQERLLRESWNMY